MSPQNDWNEWRRLVLSEIRRLAREQAKLVAKVDEYNGTNIRNTTSLEEHVKRTNLLEARLESIEDHVEEAKPVVSVLYWLVKRDNIVTKALLAIGVGAATYIVKRYL